MSYKIEKIHLNLIIFDKIDQSNNFFIKVNLISNLFTANLEGSLDEIN